MVTDWVESNSVRDYTSVISVPEFLEWFWDVEECSDTRLNQIKHSRQADFIIGNLVIDAVLPDTVLFSTLSLDSEATLAQWWEPIRLEEYFVIRQVSQTGNSKKLMQLTQDYQQVRAVTSQPVEGIAKNLNSGLLRRC